MEHAIIHRLTKARGQNSQVHLRDQELDISSPPLERLMDEIREIYEKTGKSRGVFEDDLTNFPFQRMIDQFLDQADNFVKFTGDAMRYFKYTIDQENFATGGYILFVLYQEGQNQFLMVAMLNDVTGTAIEKDNLEVIDIVHLDTKHLHLAARLNISFWKSEEQKQYLSFIKGRGAGDVSRYFLKFLGCTDYSNSRDQTKKLKEAIDAFCVDRGFDQAKKKAIKQKIFEHCEEKRKKKESVSLETLSFLVDEEKPDEFLIFANSDDIGLDSIFEPHRDMLRTFQFFTLEKQGVKLSFNKNLLQKEVFLKGDDLVFTNLSSDWLNQLREEDG